jgi:uncharacterized protein
MRNPHGWPIWYELMTTDAEGVSAFYGAVFGWSVGPQPDGPIDYRMIETATGNVGGLLALSPEMQAHGARPTWLFYLGVDDVDVTVAAVEASGGKVLRPAETMAGVGRIAMVADPQGIPFYVMRGEPDLASTSYGRMEIGKCSWNELATPDQAGANAFYAELFGWTYPDSMPMGEMGDYVFVEAAGQIIGATMAKAQQAPGGWLFYFRVPDIDAAAERVKDGGGTVLLGPIEVPGGERVIVALDPQGVAFGAVAGEREG